VDVDSIRATAVTVALVIARWRAVIPQPALDEARRVADAVPRLGTPSPISSWVGVDTPSGAVEHLDRLAAILAHTGRRYGLHASSRRPTPADYHGRSRATAGEVALLPHHDPCSRAGTTERCRLARRRPRLRARRRRHEGGSRSRCMPHAGSRKGAAVLAAGGRPVPDEETPPSRPDVLGRLAGYDAVLCMEADASTDPSCRAQGGRWFGSARSGARPCRGGAGCRPYAVMALVHSDEAVRLHHARPGSRSRSRSCTAVRLNTCPGDASMTVDMRGLD
jgi:hypothetical protein